MNWLNYHHLMYFRTIATEGSISKASEKLLVGQPALSAQLKQLEAYFDQKLFERRNRRLILTDAGKVTLKYANLIASLGTELQEVLQSQSHTVRPHLKIGALDSVPKVMIVKLIETARKIGDCHVTALDGAGDQLYRELVTHSLDLVVSNHHLVNQDDQSVYTRSIGKLPINVYGAPKFKNLRKAFPGSLNNQPVILPTSHSKLRHDVEHYLKENQVYCNVIADTQDTTIQKLLACDGVGLIIEPDFAVRQLVREGKLIKIGALAGVYEEFFLISARRVVENPIAVKLMKSFSFTS